MYHFQTDTHPDDVLRLSAFDDSRFIITVHPTDRCNHACSWCWYSRSKQRVDGNALAEFLATCTADHVSEIIVSGGGEPLMHPDIQKIADSIPANVHTRLYTNGSLRRVLMRLAGRFDYIRVSVDAGVPELYATLHGTHEAAFDELFQTLKLVSAANPSIMLGVSAVVMPENEQTMQALLDRAAISDVRYVMMKPELKELRLAGVDLSRLKAPPSVNLYVRVAGVNACGGADTGADEQHQANSSRHLFVESNGSIYPCCHLTGPRFLAGHISNGFLETVQSEQFMAAAALHQSTPHSCLMHNLSVAEQVHAFR